MPFCITCGERIQDCANFCASCGTPISPTANTTRKTVYEGELHKCPNCGDLLNAFNPSCPTCGYEIRGAKSSNSVRELANKLEQIELMRDPTQSSSFFRNMFDSHGTLNKTDEQKISLIRSYSIPNTREDILEFMILASSNIDHNLYTPSNQSARTASQRAVSDAWFAKMEQAYEKAQLTFDSTSEFTRIESIYRKKLKKIKWKKYGLFVACGISFLLFVLFVLVFGVLL